MKTASNEQEMQKVSIYSEQSKQHLLNSWAAIRLHEDKGYEEYKALNAHLIARMNLNH